MNRYDIQWIAFIVREVVAPLFALIMTVFMAVIAYRKGLFREITKKPEIHEAPHPAVAITPSELQRQLTYDVNKFDDYHQQSINQSRISFWFSLAFASIGFILIATSVFAYSDKSGYLGVVAGTIIDVVSGLFFYQSHKARQLMSDFFDKLRSDRKLEESLKLCETIDSAQMRNALKLKLSLFFSGLDNTDQIALEILRLTNTPVPIPGVGQPHIVSVDETTQKLPEADGST
ncbi:hypothetical protein [Nitrosospira sp. NRS527]|uniref:TRADD-N-associated membrane domain-containing protein n=1 Tax=Nitrosospira sp. NRS527 TaxID=155925 RepID=UPI001AF11EF5|nr:hypothetical protein [Nitrosospira sp. NRS527]BCT67320.1 hypothetical protein NNRS527_00902 [Nitrosospira sp. NRS527]